MVARIGEWIELNFWQIAVRVLSGARPFSYRVKTIQHSLNARLIGHVMSNGWVIAATGWVLGLVLGIWFAGWI